MEAEEGEVVPLTASIHLTPGCAITSRGGQHGDLGEALITVIILLHDTYLN